MSVRVIGVYILSTAGSCKSLYLSIFKFFLELISGCLFFFLPWKIVVLVCIYDCIQHKLKLKTYHGLKFDFYNSVNIMLTVFHFHNLNNFFVSFLINNYDSLICKVNPRLLISVVSKFNNNHAMHRLYLLINYSRFKISLTIYLHINKTEFVSVII